MVLAIAAVGTPVAIRANMAVVRAGMVVLTVSLPPMPAAIQAAGVVAMGTIAAIRVTQPR